MRMHRGSIFFILGSLITLGIYAITGYGLTSYNIPAGYTTTIEEFSICKDVRNAGTKNVFVPTNSSVEWNAFQTFPASGVSLVNSAYASTCCPTTCVSAGTCAKSCTWAN